MNTERASPVRSNSLPSKAQSLTRCSSLRAPLFTTSQVFVGGPASGCSVSSFLEQVSHLSCVRPLKKAVFANSCASQPKSAYGRKTKAPQNLPLPLSERGIRTGRIAVEEATMFTFYD